MTNLTKTKYFVPVFSDDEPPEDSPEPYPVHTPQQSWFNFWILSLMAIACLGFIGYGLGWFKTPSQAMEAQNAKLTQQLADQSAELEKLKACLGN